MYPLCSVCSRMVKEARLEAKARGTLTRGQYGDALNRSYSLCGLSRVFRDTYRRCLLAIGTPARFMGLCLRPNLLRSRPSNICRKRLNAEYKYRALENI